MSVRVVARVRPPTSKELDRDSIITIGSSGDSDTTSTILRIPNPKNEAELFSFQFNSVYDDATTQQQLFDNEVSPTVKHLYNGYDVTLFAYGVTGTGKTHTMRGGKSLADRGVIPRLLSTIYRKARKIEKDSAGEKQVEVAMSYYEIYNDKVFDLFESPENRTAAGLPIRDNNGKSVVVGLTERPCTTLKEFEQLYDQANVNRSTSATKLNAHSSRSHAILCVKLTQTSDERTLVSTASAIDLAGSEDNRRTDNNRERLVESASINKSLFVLAQCVEAISKKQARIPYRESKMTRILSLGQNNGLTIMILNLAPSRNFHLDTLSSLNFANRTKKIEVNEVENEPIFRGPAPVKTTTSVTGPSIHRQPLRAISIATHNANVGAADKQSKAEKSIKAFSVYADKRRRSHEKSDVPMSVQRSSKRPLENSHASSRPSKVMRPSETTLCRSKAPSAGMSKADIEDMISRRIDEKLAEKALEASSKQADALPADLQKRLDMLEQRVAGQQEGDSRAEGLQFLLMAKQHAARGEDVSALRMYELALPHFESNEKLLGKISALKERIRTKKEQASSAPPAENFAHPTQRRLKTTYEDPKDGDYCAGEGDDDEYDSDRPAKGRSQPKTTLRKPTFVFTSLKPPSLESSHPSSSSVDSLGLSSPRTSHLLKVINSRDVTQIKGLRGVGAKRAEAIVSTLCEIDASDLTDLAQLGALKGVGLKTVENMRAGVAC